MNNTNDHALVSSLLTLQFDLKSWLVSLLVIWLKVIAGNASHFVSQKNLPEILIMNRFLFINI